MKTQILAMGQVVVEFPKNQYSATVHRTSPKPVAKVIHPETEDSKRRMNLMKQAMSFGVTLSLFFVLLVSYTFAQDYTQWHLPEGAKARLGKGELSMVDMAVFARWHSACGGE